MSQNTLHNQPLTFNQKQLQQIDSSLLKLADHIAAPLVMLADVSGRLILYRGRLSNTQSTGLAALAAAGFAAGVEIGNFLGLRNKNGFRQQLQEGQKANLYTVAIGKELLLIIAFTQQTTLGLVRLFVEQTQKELLHLAKDAAQTRAEMDSRNQSIREQGLGIAISSQFEELFTNE